jgi:hypothetical protein
MLLQAATQLAFASRRVGAELLRFRRAGTAQCTLTRARLRCLCDSGFREHDRCTALGDCRFENICAKWGPRPWSRRPCHRVSKRRGCAHGVVARLRADIAQAWRMRFCKDRNWIRMALASNTMEPANQRGALALPERSLARPARGVKAAIPA